MLNVTQELNKMNIVKGDLLAMGKANEFDIIVQGCNCWNAMGSGIAKQIREQFPDAWLADQETLAGDRNKLGCYTIGMAGRLVIINAYTQYNTAKFSGEDVFEYVAFQTVLNKLTTRFGKYKFGLPMIGMGLAGGDAERIIPMLELFANQVNAQGGSVTLVEWA
jgi:O-acetyl-ADP-ribose deacetylase (regulator of RNase III)